MSSTNDRLEQWQKFVEEVREKSPVEDIVAESGAQLESAGRGQLKCCSPIRREKTPSFWVYTSNQSWHDFGTNEGGDVFSFVMARDRCDFRAALDTLARRVGLSWNPGNVADDVWQREAESYLERRKVDVDRTDIANTMAMHLPSRIRAFIRERYGFDDETIDAQRIGYAIPGLPDLLLGAGYTRERMLKTGFFSESHSGDITFPFDGRIVFPYWRAGICVYAIARRYEPTAYDAEWDQAKYKKLLTHSPDKHPFVSPTVSNEWFYNEDALARGRLSVLVITEGVTDCIALLMIGIGTVSPVTVRFRKKDLPKLIKLTERVDVVVILNDADILEDGRQPGKEGALSTAKDLYRAGRDVRIGQLPRPADVAKVDVNDFIRDALARGENARALVDDVIHRAKRLPDLLIDDLPNAGELDPTDVERRLSPIVEMVGTRGEIEREAYIRKIAKKIGFRKSAVETMVSAHVAKPEDVAAEVTGERPAKVAEDRVRGLICEDIDCYYVASPLGDDRISNFTLRLKRLVRMAEGPPLCVCDVYQGQSLAHENWVVPRGAWGSRKAFVASLPHPRLTWTGTDDNIAGLLRILFAEEVRTVRGVTDIGYHETPAGRRFVLAQGTLGPGGWIPSEEADVVYVPTGCAIATRTRHDPSLPISDADLGPLAREALPLLFASQPANVAVPFVGWAYSCAFAPRLRKRTGHFAHQILWGTQGSGKTSFAKEAIFPLLGVVGDVFNATETKFVRVKNLASTNAVPLLIDEFKPADMGKFAAESLIRDLRRGYSGETDERGRADQTTNVYPLTAPVCLSGEAPVEGDPAMLERLVPISPSKSWLDANPAARDAFYRLRSLPLWRLAASYYAWTLRQDEEEMLDRARAIVRERIAQTLPPRVYDLLVQVVFGLAAFESWASSLGVELPAIEFDAVFGALRLAVVEGDDRANVRDLADEFFEDLSTIAQQGLLPIDRVYAWRDGRIVLNLRAALAIYCGWCASQRANPKVTSARALHRILREKKERGAGSYVMSLEERVRVDGENMVRVIVLDPNRFPDSIDPFPAKTAEKTAAQTAADRWGGKQRA